MIIISKYDDVWSLLVCCPILQVEVQSLLVAEVVGGAKTTAQKSSLKNLSHLWEEVSTAQCLKHTGSKGHIDFVEGENLTITCCYLWNHLVMTTTELLPLIQY